MQYDLCFGNNTSHCGGLIKGFDRKLNYCLNHYEHKLVNKSQALCINCMLYEVHYVIINVYIVPDALVQDCLDIFAFIMDFIESAECARVICMGDFNAVFTKLDVSSKTNSEGRFASHKVRILSEFIEILELSDVYRSFYPHARKYTYSSHSCLSRIDFIFSSASVLNQITDTSIGMAYATDHSSIHICK